MKTYDDVRKMLNLNVGDGIASTFFTEDDMSMLNVDRYSVWKNAIDNVREKFDEAGVEMEEFHIITDYAVPDFDGVHRPGTIFIGVKRRVKTDDDQHSS